jgi:TFIIF-interacting CTD phosphatase-like protein
MTKFGGMGKAFLSFRPYLFEMLDKLKEHFELILYTCGTASYASAFAESVEKHGNKRYFDHVLCLSHCLFSMENELYIKDLKILEEGRKLRDVVIVDNSIQSFYLHLNNGIPIYDYNGNKADKMLPLLTEYLMTFLNVPNVRDKIDKDFKIKKLIHRRMDMYNK